MVNMECYEEAAERRGHSERRTEQLSPDARDLAAAIEHGGIEVLYQPQFDSRTGKLTGAEALARWDRPGGGGRVGADRLFAVAEREGLVETLSRHIARTALATAASWPGPLRLSINATAADVASDTFADSIADALAEAGFRPALLTIEITEKVLVGDLERTALRLQQLADLGVRIALDDFGAGFCNFRYLKRLPIHSLKLDRSMIEGVDEDPRDLAVLRGILAMARALGLEVTAEGVEREGQRAVIDREGCASWQGFLGARPLSAADFAALASA